MTTDSLKFIVETGCRSFALGASLIFQAVAKGERSTTMDEIGNINIDVSGWAQPLNSSLKLCCILSPNNRFDPDEPPVGFVEALASKDLIFDEAQSQNGLIVVTKKGCDYRLEFWYGKYLQ